MSEYQRFVKWVISWRFRRYQELSRKGQDTGNDLYQFADGKSMMIGFQHNEAFED